MGDELGCLIQVGSPGPGVCVSVCETDLSCAPSEGVVGVCDIGLVGDGFCEYGCGGADNDGKGPCPTNMECRNFGLSLAPTWQCAYAVGGGKKTQPLYDRCDPAHGPGDCQGQAVCAHPSSNVSSVQFPSGYCSPQCTQAADCVAPGGAAAEGSCYEGQCRFTCEGGEDCPTGMSCFDISPLTTLPVKRCLYVD
jgi:hypothetical protein